MSVFGAYRDAAARLALVEYVVATRGVDGATAERELTGLNAIGLAYLYRDMLAAAAAASAAALADYDPIYGAR